MKKLALALIFLAFGSICFGQKKHFQYRAEKFNSEQNKFSFPIFSSSNNIVTAKINQTLQISELEILKGFETKNIFEQVSIDDGRIYGGKVDINFKIYDNNNKILSVKLDESSCGMTCAYWVRYYNFNSGNGDLIQLKDLFTEKGYEKFFAFVTKRRIAQLKNELSKMPLSERSGYEGISGSYEADDLMDFYIKRNVLYIDGENSFSKNQKFASVEINRISQFNLSEFKLYLNDYGKSLFGLTRDSIKKHRSNILPQLFQGKIGNQKVMLVLNNGYENEMKAEYVYSKYGKGIYLEGKIKANELSLTEKLAIPKESGFIDYVDNGFIEARFDGQNITGNWTNKDKTITRELLLMRK